MTSPGIDGAGFFGLAIETTKNTYLAPTKFGPMLSETLHYVQNTKWRRPIRQTVDTIGAIAGDYNVAGDIVLEALDDMVPYFLDCARLTVVKTGASAPFTYTCTPNMNATSLVTAQKTMSITLVRNGVTFGYVGCVVTQHKWEINGDGILQVTFSIIGVSEASQTLPTPTYANGVPYGPGMWDLEIPTATVLTDADGLVFQVNENGAAQFRMDNSAGANYISYGERAITMSLTRDFTARTDYDAFKTLASQGFKFQATNGTASILITAPAIIKETHETDLSGQGNLTRSKITYMPILDPATSRSFQIVVTTPETFTP